VLPDDLEALARPVTYVTFSVWAYDQRPHDVRLYFDTASDPVVDSASTLVDCARGIQESNTWMRVGSHTQDIFSETGDRPNWGFLYLGFPADASSSSSMAAADVSRSTFASSGVLPSSDACGTSHPSGPNGPVLAFSHHFSSVQTPQETTIVLAVDMVSYSPCLLLIIDLQHQLL
jgi:hypothetical protein